MDLNQFKDIIEKGGGKIVIVENDKPTMVVMSFEEYVKQLGGKSIATMPSAAPKEQPRPLSSAQAAEMPSAAAESEREWREGLTIEDLPL